jgi:rhodanese-related sulfurtransferase
MTPQEIADAVLRSRLVLVDARDARAFARAHAAGAVSLPFGGVGYAARARARLGRWHGPLAVFADREDVVVAAAAALEAAAFEVAARFAGGVAGWQAAGLPVVEVEEVTVDALRERLGHYTVLDVREPYEWRTGVVPDAVLLPLSQFERRVDELSPERAYAVVCAHGNRSAAVAAWLAEQGFRVANVVGGMALWLGAGHPTVPAR